MENGLCEPRMEAEEPLGGCVAVQVEITVAWTRVEWMGVESTELADGLTWR